MRKLTISRDNMPHQSAVDVQQIQDAMPISGVSKSKTNPRRIVISLANDSMPKAHSQEERNTVVCR
jgi:hypothetical protein